MKSIVICSKFSYTTSLNYIVVCVPAAYLSNLKTIWYLGSLGKAFSFLLHLCVEQHYDSEQHLLFRLDGLPGWCRNMMEAEIFLVQFLAALVLAIRIELYLASYL